MPATSNPFDSTHAPGKLFATTHWTVVLAAGQGESPQAAGALEALCRAYWYPLYAYVRRRGYGAPEAEDLTQTFFARLLDKNSFAGLRRDGGKFRSFLLTALNNFLANEWARAQTEKRGGGKLLLSIDALDSEMRYQVEPADAATPEKLFERRWAAALLDQVMQRLRAECEADGKADLFAHLQPCLTGDELALPYAELAAQTNMTEAALKMTVHRLRKRYGQLLRAEIALTVASPEAVDDEIRYLLAVLSG